MNTLELHDMGVTPLSDQEKIEMNGGFVWFAPLIVGLVISAINDFDDIRKGLADGYNGTPLSEETKEVPCQ
jgi:hypothetical protein